jgi:hypothetical protein
MERAEAHAREVIATDRRAGFASKFDARDAGLRDELAAKLSGYAAEIAAAEATGLSGPHWGLFGKGYRRRDKGHDIGLRTDVKQTRRADGYLWVREGDRPDHLFLLVTGEGPAFAVVGWQESPVTMYPGFWVSKKPLPAWRVPQHVLLPLPLPGDA